MLVLSRKVGEKILIGNEISVTVVRVSGGGVRIGIDAPHNLTVVREELATGENLSGSKPEGSAPANQTPNGQTPNGQTPNGQSNNDFNGDLNGNLNGNGEAPNPSSPIQPSAISTESETFESNDSAPEAVDPNIDDSNSFDIGHSDDDSSDPKKPR